MSERMNENDVVTRDQKREKKKRLDDNNFVSLFGRNFGQLIQRFFAFLKRDKSLRPRSRSRESLLTNVRARQQDIFFPTLSNSDMLSVIPPSLDVPHRLPRCCVHIHSSIYINTTHVYT